jgi:hypothetical protein
MKKLLTVGTLVIGLIFLSNTNANAQSFGKGDMVINGGIGLGYTYSVAAGLGLPIGGGLEYGVVDLETGSIGVGGTVGYVGGDFFNILYIGAKGSYHFNELLEVENDEWDFYGGISILYRNFNISGSRYNFGSGIVPGFHAGTRYYFADNIGGYAELGNSFAWLNLGVVFKI